MQETVTVDLYIIRKLGLMLRNFPSVRHLVSLKRGQLAACRLCAHNKSGSAHQRRSKPVGRLLSLCKQTPMGSKSKQPDSLLVPGTGLQGPGQCMAGSDGMPCVWY
jgi:hypothetical protein